MSVKREAPKKNIKKFKPVGMAGFRPQSHSYLVRHNIGCGIFALAAKINSFDSVQLEWLAFTAAVSTSLLTALVWETKLIEREVHGGNSTQQWLGMKKYRPIH